MVWMIKKKKKKLSLCKIGEWHIINNWKGRRTIWSQWRKEGQLIRRVMWRRFIIERTGEGRKSYIPHPSKMGGGLKIIIIYLFKFWKIARCLCWTTSRIQLRIVDFARLAYPRPLLSLNSTSHAHSIPF